MRTENVNGKNYIVAESGTYYGENTPAKVIEVLEQCRQSGKRIRLFYGSIETGECWNEIYDIAGTVGRSGGQIKVPLLVHNSRSMGGGAILTNCILAIKETGKNGRYLYTAPNFEKPIAEIVPSDLVAEGYQFNVNVNGQLESRHKSLASAERMAARFMY